ncbi:hypothetical protein PG985_010935 [Apiospora marii]|uniref:Uncharacterized protein n=1 Tax=Apiospora marii TaxID=335849 RepID=A0ABR1SS82_9PEZI
MAVATTEAPTPTSNGLPTQVTPFSYDSPGDPCRISVYCPFLTYLAYSKSLNGLRSQQCLGVQTGGEYGTHLIHQEKCFPSNYFSIFPNEVETLFNSDPTADERARSTLAYPGTACLAGWTTACTTTLTHQGSPYPQAWCCPSGGWSCATEAGVSDREAPQRLCQSPLSESTTIWMTWDPAYSLMGSDMYTWTAEVTSEEPQNAATVFHKVFPLQLTTGLEPSVGGQGVPNDTAGNGDDTSGARLSRGAIAGIAVGSSLVVLSMAFAMFLLYIRRKKRAPKHETVALQQANHEQDPWEGKPELDGTTVTRPDEAPKSELDAIDAARESTVPAASVSELGALSPRSPRTTDGFPSPDSRHSHVFEMEG